MKQFFLTLFLMASVIGIDWSFSAQSADACPMCKSATANADESADRQPQAYFASIMFMLAVPATIFSTLGFALFKMTQAENKIVEQLEQQLEQHPEQQQDGNAP